MKAVGKYLVIKETESKSTETKGGLLLSSKQKEDIRYVQAQVLNVGTDVVGVKKKDNIAAVDHWEVGSSSNIWHRTLEERIV